MKMSIGLKQERNAGVQFFRMSFELHTPNGVLQSKRNLSPRTRQLHNN